MALKLISRQSGDSTDAIEVTEREPISRDEIRCSCGRSLRLPIGVNRTATGKQAGIREAPTSLDARRFLRDAELKLVEGKDATTGQHADQGRQLGLLGSTETMTIVG